MGSRPGAFFMAHLMAVLKVSGSRIVPGRPRDPHETFDRKPKTPTTTTCVVVSCVVPRSGSFMFYLWNALVQPCSHESRKMHIYVGCRATDLGWQVAWMLLAHFFRCHLMANWQSMRFGSLITAERSLLWCCWMGEGWRGGLRCSQRKEFKKF